MGKFEHFIAIREKLINENNVTSKKFNLQNEYDF